jgi:catechol 2,3-dioxygenase-like lactoylglutathione lyase family enzyme
MAHAAIRVADLDKSRDFYGKLGFEEAFSMSQNGRPTQSFLKINDRQFIELYPQRQPSDPIGFMHVCFESGDRGPQSRIRCARPFPHSGEACRRRQSAVYHGGAGAAEH